MDASLVSEPLYVHSSLVIGTGSLPSRVTSGANGVSWTRKNSKWRAQIQHCGKQHYLGCFAEEREAIDTVRAAREAADGQRFQQHLAGLRTAAAERHASGTDRGVRERRSCCGTV